MTVMPNVTSAGDWQAGVTLPSDPRPHQPAPHGWLRFPALERGLTQPVAPGPAGWLGFPALERGLTQPAAPTWRAGRGCEKFATPAALSLHRWGRTPQILRRT